MSAKRNIEIVIDELILEGFNPADRYAIGEALSAELERLAGSPNFTTENATRESSEAGSISIKPNSRPDTIGAQVARAVFAGLQTGK
jgi:hypothetical protein